MVLGLSRVQIWSDKCLSVITEQSKNQEVYGKIQSIKLKNQGFIIITYSE